MLKIRCKNCNLELESHPSKTKCCGCDNMTTVRGDKISAINLNLVEIISSGYNKKSTNSVLTNQDLAFQEERKNRKVKKLEFEIR
jgi:hypothetical protein